MEFFERNIKYPIDSIFKVLERMIEIPAENRFIEIKTDNPMDTYFMTGDELYSIFMIAKNEGQNYIAFTQSSDINTTKPKIIFSMF